ncbi:leucine-rich repeat-containing protein 15-like [Sycon ciliatum]|uniref:leucine-rich repeat-containing protein 15-like n=1 Tax=Sycon ciliatum TaxID=27933 RepID=UPI0031F6CA38
MQASNLCLLSVAVIYMVLAWSEPSNACGDAMCTCSNGVLLSCPNVAWLSVIQNGVTNVSASAFENNTNAQLIDLHLNKLVHVPDGMVDATYNLESLYLHHNKLVDIPDGLLDAIPKLLYLDLEGNQLTRLPDGLFDATPRLNTLYLGDNKFVQLQAGLFDTTPGLRHLFLEKNHFVHLPDRWFKALPQLFILSLVDLPLPYLPSGVPRYTPQLQYIYLEHSFPQNLRLCAIKYPKDFSKSENRIDAGSVWSYIASSGVPQGSILGPTLFLLNVCDIDQCLTPGTKLSTYADDTAMYHLVLPTDDPANPGHRLQGALDRLYLWGESWRIRF